MNIIFKELKLQNFKSHQDMSLTFGERTDISGDNAKGKTSIIESIPWLLYGTNIYGSKLDPSPVTYEATETKVSLLVTLDDKDVLLERFLIKGKASYAINETPKKATEFNELVSEYFEKDVFLSLFNPHYFFTLKWNEQRKLLLSYLTPPSSKDVLAALPEAQSKVLAELLKKKKLDDIDATHKKNKTDKEKAHLRAEGSVLAYKKQFEGMQEIDQEQAHKLKEEDDDLTLKQAEIDDELAELKKKNAAYEKKQAEINEKSYEIKRSRDNFIKRKDEEIKEDCPTCKRPLNPDTVKVVQEQKKKELTSMRASHSELMEERVLMNNELKELVFTEAGKLHEQANEISNRKHAIRQQIHDAENYTGVKQMITDAEKERDEALKSKNESIFILDAIKDYRAKEAELQGEKAQGLFETLTIRLTEKQKNKEVKPAFVIQLDGKDHNMLSLSESIRAGLELREVLSEQANIIAPTVVDNSESITRYKGPTGQLITSRVVADKELEVVAG